jgi:hypothetical protein
MYKIEINFPNRSQIRFSLNSNDYGCFRQALNNADETRCRFYEIIYPDGSKTLVNLNLVEGIYVNQVKDGA